MLCLTLFYILIGSFILIKLNHISRITYIEKALINFTILVLVCTILYAKLRVKKDMSYVYITFNSCSYLLLDD